MIQPNKNLPPLNTPAVAKTGLATAAIGIFGPVALAHLFPHAPSDVHDAMTAFFMFLTTGGVFLSYKGMPGDVARLQE